MKRYKKYERIKNQNSELNHLRNQCYKLIDKIVATGDIKRKDLFMALAIRLKISFDNCYINKFDEKMCNKAIKELTYML